MAAAGDGQTGSMSARETEHPKLMKRQFTFYFSIAIIGVGLLAGCGKNTTIVWNDLTITNKTAVSCNLEAVSSLHLHVEGKIDGVGKLITPNRHTNLLSGIIRTNYGMDHFSTNCTIIYEPVSSKAGQLELIITFSRF